MATEKRLIDAYALMDCIRDSKRHNPHDDPTVAKNHMFEHDHFMKMVSLAPTVNAEEVVHGSPGPSYMEEYYGEWKDCLECGTDNIWPSNYCRICGAKMDGGADNGI